MQIFQRLLVLIGSMKKDCAILKVVRSGVTVFLISQSLCAQGSLSLDFTDAPLKEILQHIEARTSYRFVYNNDQIDVDQKFTIKVPKDTISEEKISVIMQRLFQDSIIEYSVRGNRVILTSRNTSRKKDGQSHTQRGVVKDAVTGEALIGANIEVLGPDKGLFSNAYGFYSLTLASGRYTLSVSHVGYAKKDFEIDLTGNRVADILLVPVSDELQEVVVTGQDADRSKSVFNGASTLRAEDIKGLPVLFGEPDVTRTMLTLPGVTTVAEGASGFNVRGGNIDQNLILLDEAPVYNPSHALGFFSAFNTDVIKSMDFYKGGIPGRYGGRASSVLDIRQREGSDQQFRGEGGIGLLISRLTLEGPIQKDKIGFIVSGRRSYADLFFPLFEELRGNKLYFFDASGKLSFDINERNKLFLSGYTSGNVIRTIDPEGFNPYPQLENDQDVRWKNNTATLRWNRVFSDKLFMNLSGIYSDYTYELRSQSASDLGFRGDGPIDWTSRLRNLILKPDFTYYTDIDTRWRFGLSATLYRFAPTSTENILENFIALDFGIDRALELAAYTEWEKSWERWNLNLGLRYSNYTLRGPATVVEYDANLPRSPNNITGSTEFGKGETIRRADGLEPRLALSYRMSDRTGLKAGYSRAFQYVHLLTNTLASFPYDLWKLSGPYVDPLRVDQFSGGLSHNSKNGVYGFTVEGYYKLFDGLLEYKNGAQLLLNPNVETELLPAEGFAYGLEISGTKNTGRLTGQLNYTYSVSRRRTTSFFQSENLNQGDYFPSNFDSPHVFNLRMDYPLGKKWEVGAYFTYRTGRPVTRPTGKVIYENEAFLTYDLRNTHRLSPTHRLDVSATYKPARSERKLKGSWSFGLYNLYGRDNTFGEQYDLEINTLSFDPSGEPPYDYGEIEVRRTEQSLFSIPTPFITYNFNF